MDVYETLLIYPNNALNNHSKSILLMISFSTQNNVGIEYEKNQ